jgi:hypothetical protein
MKLTMIHPARILIVGALVALVAGCGIVAPIVPGEDRTDTTTTDAGGATSASVEVDLGAGQLTLAGGSSGLATTKFTYNVESWKPTVDYTVSNSRGTLVIAQPNAPVAVGKSVRNDWDVRLSNSIPLDLKINTGAAKSTLTLGGMALVSATISGGAGELQADLSGDWKKSAEIDVNGGVGKISVQLPSSVGARVKVSTGLGSVTVNGLTKSGDTWVNDQYGTSPVTVDLVIKAGVGEVNLDVK